MKEDLNLGGNIFSDFGNLVKTAVVTGVDTMLGKAQEKAAADAKKAIENLQADIAKKAGLVTPPSPIPTVTPSPPMVVESPVVTFLKAKGAYVAAGLGGVLILSTLMRRKS